MTDDIVIWYHPRCSTCRGAEQLLAGYGIAARQSRYLDDATPDALLDAMAVHPELIERPLVIRGDRAVVARPPELLLSLLDPE